MQQTIAAPCAASFDPAAWLAIFERAGGGYAVTDRLSLCIIVEGRSEGQIAAARSMVNELTEVDRNALVAYLRGRA